MTDKLLTESDWKSFAKREKLDDAKEASKDTKALHEAVLEALQDLQKKEGGKPAEVIAALDKFAEAMNRQVLANAKRKDKDGKAIKDTKDVKDQLHKMLAASEKSRKELESAKGDADDEEESPALLTSKMLSLVREVRKGDLVLEALIAVAGKESVVLLARSAISPSRGKLLKDQMTNPGGLKFIRGQCLLEEGTLTFVVQSPAAGLAKKIKAALFAQVALKLKVRVRGEDPADVDEEGEEDAVAPGAPGAQGSAQTGAPAGTQASAKAQTAPIANSDSAANTAQQAPAPAGEKAWTERLQQLQERYDEALRARHPEATKLRAVMGFASEKADVSHDYAAAIKALGMIEQILGAKAPAANGGAGAAAVAGTAPDTGTGTGATLPKGDFVRMQTCRLVWEAARKKVARELAQYRQAVETAFEGEEEEFDVLDGLEQLDDIMVNLDARLIDTLDEMLDERTTPSHYQVLLSDAKEQLADYEAFTASNPLLGNLDGPTPFGVSLSVTSTLGKTLQNLRSALH